MVIKISFKIYYRIFDKSEYLTIELMNGVAFFFISCFFVWSMMASFSEELYQLLNGNVLILIFLLFFSLLISFLYSLFMFNYGKYHIIKTKNVIFTSILSFILILIFSLLIRFYLNINVSIFLLKIFREIFLFLFMICFPFLWISCLRRLEPNPLKSCFKRAQSGLEGLLKQANESFINKNLIDVHYIVSNYNDGIKEIKNSFGEVIYFNNIDIINLNTKKSITEILDQLTFSIPFYIFYGEKEQMKEMVTHIKNLDECIGDIYTIAGGKFVTEILQMNDKINTYFKENSFKLSQNKYTSFTKYDYYIKNLFLFVLTLLGSLIIYTLNLPSFK